MQYDRITLSDAAARDFDDDLDHDRDDIGADDTVDVSLDDAAGAPPVVPRDARLIAAIDRHVAMTAGTLADVFVTTIVLLDEPAVHDARLARRCLEDLVDTLLGVAAGVLSGRVVSAMIRAFGDDIGHQLERRVHEALIRIGPGRAPLAPHRLPCASSIRAPIRFLHDVAARPLVGELATRVHPRLGRTAHDHHAALSNLAGAVALAHIPALVATLEMLGYDLLLANLWSDHIQLAWQFYTAAVARQPREPTLPPELGNSLACETWRAWLRRMRGDAPAAMPEASAR
jgi:hypothetical protein